MRIDARSRLFAKGRLKPGQMNKTESAYAAHLEAERYAGRVVRFWFEKVKLKIADHACGYEPDFMVLRPDGEIEFHEVKGSPAIFQDDAKVKVKVCATEFPFKFFVVYPKAKKAGGGWTYQEY